MRKNISSIYDELMVDSDYQGWAKLTAKYARSDSRILDIGCGSGTLISILGVMGYKVDGLDISPDMLAIAKSKCVVNHSDSQFFQGDMSTFRSNEKYDVVVCYCNTMNHLRKRAWLRVFQAVYDNLNVGGYFIFDMFNKSYMDNCFANKFEDETDNITWTMKKKPWGLVNYINVGNPKNRILSKQFYHDPGNIIYEDMFQFIKTYGECGGAAENSDVYTYVLQKKKRSPVVMLSHELLQSGKKNVAVDATCGWGNDSVFLARNFKRVYSFDILDVAVAATKELVKRYASSTKVIKDSFNNIDKYVKGIDAAIFNLGYLPKTDKSVTTFSSDSAGAILKCHALLNKEGLIVVCVYTAHCDGLEEHKSIIDMLNYHCISYFEYDCFPNGERIIKITKH